MVGRLVMTGKMADPSEPAEAIRVRLDGADAILDADALIRRLHEAAGGVENAPIALPQIAGVARLVRRLGVGIARPLMIGLPEQEYRLWARARPLDNGVVELSLSDWQEVVPEDRAAVAALRAAEIALAPKGDEWRIDAAMRFVSPGPDLSFIREGVGLEECFDGIALLEEAMGYRRPFFSVPVQAKPEGRVYLLSGYPLFDADGGFLGYRGKASVDDAEPGTGSGASAPAAGAGSVASPPIGVLPLGIPDFGRKVDRSLRQPLGRIIANAETISGRMEGPLRGDYAAYAADIASAGRHLMELVDDLADLQAIDRINFTVAREPVDLADIARRASGLLGVKAADRTIRIVAPAIGETAPAIGEFRRALQITVNLLNNAIRYSPEGSTIWLRADVEGTVARLVVADQGKGIAPEDQARVFDKFERLGREDAAGSGLGLYISRRLARAMQGDLTVDSAPGQGARFVLTLPVGQVVPDPAP